MKNRIQSVHPGIQTLLISFTEEILQLFGENLFSLLLYGSAAGANFIHGKSNVNLLIVLKELKFSHLKLYQKRSLYWKKKGIDPPLISTVDFLEKSKNVFPIEWLEIISHHIILHGENPFKFSIDNQDLRRQCEKEIREILIRLRQAFLETENRPEEIERLALTSLNSVFPIFRSLLTLQKEAPPPEREELTEFFCRKNHLSAAPFLKIWAIKKGKTIPDEDYLLWFEDYLNQLEELSNLIDQFNAI
jgi:hypothetical protein